MQHLSRCCDMGHWACSGHQSGGDRAEKAMQRFYEAQLREALATGSNARPSALVP